MSRKSKSRTRRNNYKSKRGKYKKVRKTQRRTRRNRHRGGFFDKLRRSVGVIKSKGRDLKSKIRTYATDGTWGNQPKENLESLKEVARRLDKARDTRLEAKLRNDGQYLKSKKLYDNRTKWMRNPGSERRCRSGNARACALETKRFLNETAHDQAEYSGEMKKRKRELARATRSIRHEAMGSDDRNYHRDLPA